MHFDSIMKNLIRCTIGLSLFSMIASASALTLGLFYITNYKQQNFVTAYTEQVTLTSYRSIRSQTDSSPTWTSIGHRTHPYGCALSRDLLKRYGYGSVIYIPGFGFRIVNDVMGPKSRQAIDLWVKTLKEEKEVGIRKVEAIVLCSPQVAQTQLQ